MVTKIEELKDLNIKTFKIFQQSAFSDRWEFIEGDTVFATMIIPSMWTNRGVVESSGKKWNMERKGVFTMDVTIEDAETNSKIGIIRKFFWRPDEIELFGQYKYKIKWVSFWKQKWMIVDHVSRKVAIFSTQERGFKDFFKHQASVEIMSDFKDRPELVLLITAAWYYHILEAKTAAAAAAAGGGS